MKKAIAVFVTLLVCVVLLCSCSSATTSTPASTASTSSAPATSAAAVPRSVLVCPQGGPDLKQTPQYGGTLKLIYNHDVTNLGAPWKIFTFFDEHLNRYAIENLIGLDSQGNPVAQLATDWVHDPVSKTITFTLRQGVKFHDGTDFNATAVKWCLDMYRNSTHPELKAVTSIDVIDDYHVKLTFSAWDAGFIQGLSSSGAGKIVSPTAAQKLGNGIMLNPVGTGPFKFVSFQPNVALKYTKFDGYWQKGLPYLDGVEIDFVADSVVALTSFLKGEGHALYGISPSDAEAIQKQGYTIYNNATAVQGICGDTKNQNSPFADIRIRQAIAYAIDNKTLVSAYNNMFSPVNQLALPGGIGYNSAIKGYPYNPAKAQELLAQAGYSTANPLTTKLVYPIAEPQRADVFTLVQSELAKVGINVTLQPVAGAPYSSLSTSGWNNELFFFTFSYNPVESQWGISAQQSLASKKQQLVSIYTPDAFDTLLNATMAENDMGKREANCEQLNKMAIDDYCMVLPFFIYPRFIADSPSLHDFNFANIASFEFLPEIAWLSKTAASTTNTAAPATTTATPATTTTAPATTTEAPAGATLSWQEAAKEVGKTVTVVGKVVDVVPGWQTQVALQLGTNPGDFDVVIMDPTQFSGDLATLFKGKTIAVTGRVTKNSFTQAIEIDVTDASQIVLQK